MAWLYKQKGSANWWIGQRVNGRQILRSTGTADRKEAEKELAKIEMLVAAQRTGALEDVYRALTNTSTPKISLKIAADEWLAACKALAAGTHERYEDAILPFLNFYNATPTKPLLREISTDQVQAFLAHVAGRQSAASTNQARRILSVFFNHAVARGHITANPVKLTKRWKVTKAEKKQRRPFSAEELRAVFKAAPDSFWRYMVTGATYTGLRLGDLASLRRNEIDLQHNELILEATKTGKVLHIPLAAPFRLILEHRLAELGRGKGSDFLWPDEAATYQAHGSPPLSNKFYERVLVPAGLAPKRTHKKQSGERASDRRKINELSFHSFRHSFVSLLKLSGASQSVAKELAGHTSDAVNDLYTSIPADVLAKAIQLLPEVTA